MPELAIPGIFLGIIIGHLSVVYVLEKPWTLTRKIITLITTALMFAIIMAAAQYIYNINIKG